MSEWQRVKFEDLLVGKKISYGVVQPGQFQEVGGVPLIRVNNIKNAKVDVSDIVKIHEDVEAKYAKTRLSGGELLITVVGSVGECAIVTEDLKGFNVARAVSVANIIDGVDKRFVAYQFRTEDLKFQMYGNTNDTVQPTLNLTELKQLTFTLPPLPEQKAIASVLSSLDDKIDLLHRQNKTLEAMAETLFRQWFIEEAKEDWEESDLSQLISLQSGYAFKSKDFQDQGTFGVLKIKNISGNIIDIDHTDFVSDEVGLATAQRFHVKSGQVLFAMTGAEIGKLGLVPKTAKQLLLNQRVGLLVPHFEGAEYLAYLHLKSEFGQDYIENSATGSAQPNISGSLIEACPFPNLDNEFLQQCGKKVQIYYDKLKENLGQIQTLENLRDTLLPKLMSGEV
ncbi:restriction endonuclease subunit S, partial [Acinetobacter calcoaceticus]|uniref:restriction endonuclease subunit S n=1 Tax=Acinetobacter calcoaceticus TaxID=471 RepID=UPI00300A39DB